MDLWDYDWILEEKKNKEMELMQLASAPYLYSNKNKPPAMPVCPQLALASSKKPPML